MRNLNLFVYFALFSMISCHSIKNQSFDGKVGDQIVAKGFVFHKYVKGIYSDGGEKDSSYWYSSSYFYSNDNVFGFYGLGYRNEETSIYSEQYSILEHHFNGLRTEAWDTLESSVYIESDNLYVRQDTIYVCYFLKANFNIQKPDTMRAPTVCPVSWNHFKFDLSVDSLVDVRELKRKEIRRYSLSRYEGDTKLYYRYCD